MGLDLLTTHIYTRGSQIFEIMLNLLEFCKNYEIFGRLQALFQEFSNILPLPYLVWPLTMYPIQIKTILHPPLQLFTSFYFHVPHMAEYGRTKLKIGIRAFLGFLIPGVAKKYGKINLLWQCPNNIMKVLCPLHVTL